MLLGCSSRSLALPWVKQVLGKPSPAQLDCLLGSYVREYRASSVFEALRSMCTLGSGGSNMWPKNPMKNQIPA